MLEMIGLGSSRSRAAALGFGCGASIAVFAILVTKLIAAPALRGANECTTAVTPELRIRACGALIESKGQSNAVLSSAYIIRAQARADQKDIPGAINDYTKAAEFEQNRAAAFNARGMVHLTVKDNTKAIADFTQAIEKDPKLGIAHFHRGNAYLADNQPAEAVRDFDTALSLNRSAAAYLARGKAHQRLDNLDPAVRDLNEAIRLDEKNGEAHLERGKALARKNIPEQAFADFAKAESLLPDEQKSRALNAQGELHYDREQFDAAIESLTKAIDLDRNYLTALNNRGVAYQYKNEPERALDDFNRALELDPQATLALQNRAFTYATLNNYERALQDLDKVIDREPGNAVAFNNRCWIRAVSGQMIEQAIEDCSSALKLRPGHVPALDSRALAYLRAGRYPQAIADYTAVLARQPRQAMALFGRGTAKMMLKQDGSADIRAATEINPNIEQEFPRMPAAN